MLLVWKIASIFDWLIAEVKSTQLEMGAKVTLTKSQTVRNLKFSLEYYIGVNFLIVTFLEKFENCTLEFRN